MYYYPSLLETPNRVNIQVVFPGGWGQLGREEPGLHFLWENLFFAPTKTLTDPDKWLWEHTLDFWSVTSFESIRLNFTLHPSQVSDFIPVLKDLLQPRPVAPDFIKAEINDLKTYWLTERDEREDAVLRELFKSETVVPANPRVVSDLQVSDAEKVYPLWQPAQPHLIILGVVPTDDVIALSQIGHQGTDFTSPSGYAPPHRAQEFFTHQRWGLKFELPVSHLFELVLMELWEQQFGCQFFFEYHLNDLFIWTNAVEQPDKLAQKVKQYQLNQTDFNHALHRYVAFLHTLFQGENFKSLEKLSELIEGFHPHPWQTPTFGVSPHQLKLEETLAPVDYKSFAQFYSNFTKPLNKP